MPVISIKSLPFEKDVNIPEILKKLNAEVANSMNYSPDSIWSYWEFITPQYYAVGDKSSEKTTGSTHSPIIEITSFEGKSNESIETAMKTTAKVVSQALGIDIGNIFIVYKEAHSGMVFDGGNIVYKKS